MPLIIQLILFTISNWATIWKIVKTILELIRASRDKKVVKEGTEELKEALLHFKATGDKGKLEGLLCKLQGKCKA